MTPSGVTTALLCTDVELKGAEPKGRAACPSARFCLSTSLSEEGADHHTPGNDKGHPYKDDKGSSRSWQ